MLTDHEGRFSFQVLDETVSTLQITKPGFALSPEHLDSPTLSLASFPDRSSVEALIYPDAILTGAVTTVEGYPLPHVFVTVRRSLFSESGHLMMPVSRTQTDSHGSFRTLVPAGDYIVESELTRLPYEDGKVVLPVVLPAQSSSDPGGFHVHSGEELHVELSSAVSQVHSVTFNASPGQEGPPPRITARAPNGLATAAPMSSGSGRNRGGGEMSIDLPNGTYVLEASARRAGGEEVGQSTVTVADHDISGVSLHFAQVPPIPIEISVSAEATSNGQATSLSPSTPQLLSLTLQNTEISLDPASSYAVSPEVIGDRTSVFRAAPGRYRLHASSSSSWYVASASYGATNLLQGDMIIGPSVGSTPMHIVVSDQTGSINGAVRLTGSPASCWIYLVASDPSASPISLQRSTTDGTFTFAHVPPGVYRALAFEHKHSDNFLAPAVLATFTTRVQQVTVQAGERSSIALDAVPTRDLLR